MNSSLTTMRRLSLIVGLATATACGGDNTGPGANGDNGGCTITLTGALTGSPACSGVTAIWAADSNTFLFGYFTGLTDSPAVIVSVTAPGKPAVTTYHLTDAGAFGSAAITAGTSGWIAQTADTANSVAASGSYTLTITSLSTITTAAEGKVYRVHGTFNATLPPAEGTDGTGTVTLVTRF